MTRLQGVTARREDRNRDEDMHFFYGERKHSTTTVPLIGRVVSIHEGIDNRDELAAAVTVAAVGLESAAVGRTASSEEKEAE